MQPADKRVDSFDSGKSLSVVKNVDHSRMAAARNYNEPLAVHIAYNALVVPRPGVRYPCVVPLSVLDGEPFLEICYSLDLPRHQCLISQEKRGLAFLHKLDILPFKGPLVRGRHVDLDT